MKARWFCVAFACCLFAAGCSGGKTAENAPTAPAQTAPVSAEIPAGDGDSVFFPDDAAEGETPAPDNSAKAATPRPVPSSLVPTAVPTPVLPGSFYGTAAVDRNSDADAVFTLSAETVHALSYHGNEIPAAGYALREGKLLIQKSIWGAFPSGEHFFTAQCDGRPCVFRLLVTDSRTPVLTSSDSAQYKNGPVTFSFALYGGELEFSGDDLQPGEYSCSDGTVTVSSNYFERLNRSAYTFTYTVWYRTPDDPEQLRGLTGELHVSSVSWSEITWQ